MLIEITYNVTDVFMSTTETPVYVEISFEQPGGTSAVWGSITGTLSDQTDLQNALNAKLDESTIDGGTEGQILSKASATDFDFAWINNYAKYLATNVRNQTGSTIAAFQVVYISGATGNKPLISLADADTEATSSKTYGVTATSIANNGTGDVVTAGELSGINTSAFNEGDLLWLSTTAGGVVTTPPAEPAHAVFIGYVVRSHPTLGTIDVSIQNGYELNELHGVQITTPTDNQGLFYNSSNSLWENKSITTALGYTPVPTTRNITINGVTYDLSADRTYTISTGISGSGASGQVTYWTGASAVSGSNNLFWDNTNGRLGIGINAPLTKLHIRTGNAASTLEGLRLGNGSNDPNAGNRLSFYFSDNTVNIAGAFIDVVKNGSDADMILSTSSTNATPAERVRLTGNGNLGIAVTPNAWTVVKALQIQRSSFSSYSDASFASSQFTTNGYYDGSWRYVGTGGAAQYNQQTNNVAHFWSIAPSGTAGNAITFTQAMTLFNTGNLSIGTPSDIARLGVVGDTLLRGSGATSATTALTVQNSSSTNLFRLRNDGEIVIGPNGNSIFPADKATFATSLSGNGITFYDGSQTTGTYFRITGNNITDVGGASFALRVQRNYVPASGNGTFVATGIESTINQVGATGITRGLYVNPTLTAAADWRSIEWSNNSGWGLYGAGTANNLLNGRLYIPAGSYDLPSLSFVNDTNTGLFSPLADNIELKTGTNNAVVLENQGVNLIENSENLGTFPTNFQQISVSIPGNVAAPDGTLTANIAVPDTSLNQHRFYRIYSTTSPFTMSVYAKAAGYNFISFAWGGGVNGEAIIFDLVNGTISGTAGSHTASIENVGNGWFRCSLSYTSVGASASFSRWIIVRNANSTANYSGDGTSGVYVWGWQMEENTASTSYTKTGATAVTRPQAISLLGQNLYGNLITRRVTGPSLTDLSFVTGFTDRMTIHATSGNVMINSSSDLGQRLQVIGDTLLRGSGATSATTALTVQNSSSTNLFTVQNNGAARIAGTATLAGGAILQAIFINQGQAIEFQSAGIARFYNAANSLSINVYHDGTGLLFSGASTFSSSLQVGGGTINASAILQADSTTKGFLPPRMTTTQKNAIATPAAGLVVYDTTLNKLCVYTTAWETITSI